MHRPAFAFLFFWLALSCTAQQPDTLKRVDWEFSAAANFYIFPDDHYINPNFSVSHEHLFLQGRYNYEDLHTGSIFGGYTFGIGKKVEFSATPVVGAVFGNTNGIAPGLLWELNWKKLSVYSESEYLIDLSGKESNFYYAWGELTYAPADWMFFGLVVQRTRLYQTDLDTQSGLMLGFTEKFLTVTTYVFNPGYGDVFGVVSVVADF